MKSLTLLLILSTPLYAATLTYTGKQQFTPTASTAGVNVGSIAGDVTAPANGDLWYNSAAGTFRARINNANVSLGAGIGSIPDGSITNVMLANGAVATLSGTNTGDNSPNSLYSGLSGIISAHTSSTSNPHSVTKSQVGLALVENTALSTWAGTSNIATVGTVNNGVWNATAIADAKIASAATWNAKQTALVSGTNIKTVNGTPLLGAGNIVISGGDISSGPVTATGGVSTIGSNAITNAMLANAAVASLSGTNTGDNAVNSLYSGLVTNANHTGDATGSTVLTLATVNSNVGTFGNASNYVAFTVNAKGQVIAASQSPWPTFNQNTTGNAATATLANTVTTNANLTGDVTSTGNATSIATGAIVNADINASAGILLSKTNISLTTTGSSGAATLNTTTGVLNIPQYSGGAGSVAADVIWDAAGDLVYGTGADTATRLGIGTNGQILHVSGGIPAWTSTPTFSSITVTGSLAVPSINLAGTVVTATGAELNHLIGVSGPIQTQFTAKANAASPALSGTVSGTFTLPTTASVASSPAAGDSDTSLASTAFVQGEVDSTQTATHSAPATTTPLSPTWTGPMHTVWNGVTGTTNLPAAAGYAGRGILIYNTGAFTATIDANGSEVIVRDGTVQTGGVSMTLSTGAGNFVALISDGSRWVTLGYKGTLAEGS